MLRVKWFRLQDSYLPATRVYEIILDKTPSFCGFSPPFGLKQTQNISDKTPKRFYKKYDYDVENLIISLLPHYPTTRGHLAFF